MSNQSWVQTLVNSQVDGPAVNTVAVATSILPTAAFYTIPSNYFNVGSIIRARAFGRVSSFTSGTLTLGFWLGSVATPIIVFTSGALTTVVSLTNQTFELHMDMTVRSIGSGTAATIMGTGRMTSSILTGGTSAAQAMSWLLPTTAPVVGTGFDSTITNVANMFATWSVSNAANSIQVHQYTLESMN